MKTAKQVLILTFLLSAFCVSGISGQESIEGDWAGGSNLFPNSYGFIKARFEKTKTGFGGFFNAQTWAAKRPISNVRIESSKVHFEFPSTAGIPFVADGELKDGVIRGEIRRGDEKGEFHLVRVAPVNPQIYKDYVGAYRISPNDVRVVTWSAFGHLRTVAVEGNVGETDWLLPLGGDKFFFGQLQMTIPLVKDKKWLRSTLGGIPRTSWIWESTRLTSFFEPVPALQKIKCPVLLIFGGDDANYPAQRSAEIMARALRGGGNCDVTTKIFQGADHGLLVRQTDGRMIPAPDPDNTKYNWLLKRVNVDF